MTTTQTATRTSARNPTARTGAAGGENLACSIVHGPDRTGIVASVLSAHDANIASLNQYSDDPQGGRSYQRTVFSLDNLEVALPRLQEDLQERLVLGYDLQCTVRDLSVPKRVAIFASKSEHCLLDLLWRHRRGELPVTVSMVISNHPDLAEDVRSFGIPFFLRHPLLPRPLHRAGQVRRRGRAAAPAARQRRLRRPGAVRADPRRRLHRPGGRADHQHPPLLPARLQRRGADLERAALSRAVARHSEDGVIRAGNQTIVFA